MKDSIIILLIFWGGCQLPDTYYRPVAIVNNSLDTIYILQSRIDSLKLNEPPDYSNKEVLMQLPGENEKIKVFKHPNLLLPKDTFYSFEWGSSKRAYRGSTYFFVFSLGVLRKDTWENICKKRLFEKKFKIENTQIEDKRKYIVFTN